MQLDKVIASMISQVIAIENNFSINIVGKWTDLKWLSKMHNWRCIIEKLRAKTSNEKQTFLNVLKVYFVKVCLFEALLILAELF